MKLYKAEMGEGRSDGWMMPLTCPLSGVCGVYIAVWPRESVRIVPVEFDHLCGRRFGFSLPLICGRG